jgi:hypothetical protein
MTDADSVAAAHGYPQAFEGHEPPASAYDSAFGLSPALGGPADGPPLDPAVVSPATKAALGLDHAHHIIDAPIGHDEARDMRGTQPFRQVFRRLGGPPQQRQHEVAGAVVALGVDEVVEGLNPFGCLVGVDIDVLGW